MGICQADKSPVGVRDAALIAILRCGLRRAEVVALHLKDVDLATGALEIIGGKGETDRMVYMARLYRNGRIVRSRMRAIVKSLTVKDF